MATRPRAPFLPTGFSLECASAGLAAHGRLLPLHPRQTTHPRRLLSFTRYPSVLYVSPRLSLRVVCAPGIATMKKRLQRQPETCPTAYDAFALAYNTHWGPLSLQWTRWLATLLLPRVSPGSRILDVCCGTGQISSELSRHGYHMVGLDGSRQMLRYAKANASRVQFIQADVRRFGLSPWFDAALCLFDSLNHLLSTDDLAAAFRSIAACLMPGAWFLFDVNTPRSYELYWKGRSRLTACDHQIRTNSVYYRESGIGLFTAAIRPTGSAQQRASTVTLWQRCHHHEEVLAALRATGFCSIETYMLEHDILASGYAEQAERAFYLARRSSIGTRR